MKDTVTVDKDDLIKLHNMLDGLYDSYSLYRTISKRTLYDALHMVKKELRI